MIAGTITEADYLAAQRLHRSSAVRRLYGVLALALALGLVAWSLGFPLLALAMMGAAVGGLAGEFASVRVFFPRRMRHLYRQQKALHVPYVYRWDAERLEVASPDGQAIRRWDSYVRCRENQMVILLYHADNLFELFPKSWFSDPAQLEAFRSHAILAGQR